MTDLLEANLLLGTLILPKEKKDKKKKTTKESFMEKTGLLGEKGLYKKEGL